MPESLIRCHQVKRDGSVVGGIGYEGLHDGRCTPFIAQKGRIVRIKNLDALFDVEVLESRSGGELVIEKFNDLHRASLKSGTLRVLEKIPRKPMTDDHSWRKMAPDKGMRSLFPPPKGMEDTTGIESVYWSKSLFGCTFCLIESVNGMLSGYRTAIKLPSGKVVPFENCLPSLDGYVACGIHEVNKEGWIMIDAYKKEKGPNNNFRTGAGYELFWIEVRPRN